MTPRALIGLIAIGLAAATADARIGETEKEIGARYGDPIFGLPRSETDVGLTKGYLSGGFSIAVTYLNGCSVREMLAKPDKSTITDTEIHVLLSANAGGSSWEARHLAGEKSVPPGVQEWRSTDQQSRVAFYDSRTHAFFVTTQHFIDLTGTKNQQTTARSNRGELWASGNELRKMKTLERGNAIALQRRQPLPSPSPARK